MDNKELDQKEQQLLAFALFIAGMRIGPDVFSTLESIAAKVGVTKPFILFASDWVKYSNTCRDAAAAGKSLFQGFAAADPDEMPI